MLKFAESPAVSTTYSRANRNVVPAELVQDNLQMVRKIAWHVSSRMSSAVPIEDLIQTGLVALIEAASAFEDRGLAFASYASVRVRGAMIDDLRRIAAISRSGMANRRALNSARAMLESQLGRAASQTDMMSELNLDAASYFAMVDSAQAAVHEPIDEVYSDQNWAFADVSKSPHDHAEDTEMRMALTCALSHLSEREAMILQLFFVEELNLHEIGETLGVGAARVCQIKKSALAKVRGFLDPVFTDEDRQSRNGQ